MNTAQTQALKGDQAAGVPGAKTFTVGSLCYDQRQLVVLFFWLMWNDFSIMLLEQVNQLCQILFKDRGASNTEIATIVSISSMATIIINPWFSTWSDRHRGKWGRRRPFLLLIAPPLALSLMAIPYMPDLYRFLVKFHGPAALLGHIPISGPVLFLGIGSVFFGIFNAMILALFSYLYWDVVPEKVLGRFQSLSKLVTLLAGLLWSFCIFGLAEHHMKAVFVAVSAFCLVIYVLSVWKIKEGEYPPPDPHKKGGLMAPVRAYFVECFSKPFYLWIFAANTIGQIGNKTVGFQLFYAHYDLHLDLETIGWSQGWGTMATVFFGLFCGFLVGSMTDRLKPVRLKPFTLLLAAFVQWGSYLFVDDKWSYLISYAVINVVAFVDGVVTGALTIEIYPREKLGQFCSANAMLYTLVGNIVNPFVGLLFDHIHYYRFSFFWTALFYFLSACFYVKIYFNWRRRQGHVPVPHAG